MGKGFVDQWLICGAFFSDRGWATLDEDYLFGEAVVAPEKGSKSFGRAWQEFDTKDGFLQFLFAPFKYTLFCTAYAHTYVKAPRDMDALLLTGSDDGIKTWLNGKVVLRNDVNRAAVPGDDRAGIHLKSGWNSLLVKVRQGMAHWQFCAQILDHDGVEIPELTSAREAEYPIPRSRGSDLGVRVRFTAETYEFADGVFSRETQFEVGCIGSEPCEGISLGIKGSPDIHVGSLAPGETRVVTAKLPFTSVIEAVQGRVQATADGKPSKVKVLVSEPSRLLRDLFAPLFIPSSATAPIPKLLRRFGWSQFTSDLEGRYMLVDPPGLRRYLGGLVGRFPMKDEDAAAARSTCADLLRLALNGRSEEFKRMLAAAKLPDLVRTT